MKLVCRPAQSGWSGRLAALLGALVVLVAAPGQAADLRSVVVPLREAGATTLYVSVEIAGLGPRDYLVDTGAGYTTIDEGSLEALRGADRATYVKSLEGVLADGSKMVVPVYRIPGLNIGGDCPLAAVEVAVFPGVTRGILGLNVLRRTAPFTFSLGPPALHLTGCSQATR